MIVPAMKICFIKAAFVLFLLFPCYGNGQDKAIDYDQFTNWYIASAGHVNIQFTNTAGFPENMDRFFTDSPFEITIGEFALNLYKGRFGLGTHVFSRSAPVHYMVEDKHPFFSGWGKTSWFPVIIRVPVLLSMKYNWMKGISVKYTLSTLEYYRTDFAFEQYNFNGHNLAIEMNTQGTIIELGYHYQVKHLSTQYIPEGKNYLFLKLGLGFLGNHFWNRKLNQEIIKTYY